jgi:hypothetical protein
VIVLKDAGTFSISNAEKDAIVSAALSSNPKIYIFTILYYDGGTTSGSSEAIMKNLAYRTYGKFYKPSTPDELQQAYIDIANTLRERSQTPFDTYAMMNLDFQNVNVDNTPMIGGEVFDYIPKTKTIWNQQQYDLDQSHEWNANHQLHFNNLTNNSDFRWSTTFRLKAKQTGTIDVFGDRSALSFYDGSESQMIPQTILLVKPRISPVPEFPSAFLPATMIIGFLGAVLLIQRTREH